MNRRGFIGILGGYIGGSALAPKAFATEFAPAAAAGLEQSFVADTQCVYQQIAHEALDILDRELRTKRRYAAVFPGWRGARTGHTINATKLVSSGKPVYVTLNRVAGAQFPYSATDLIRSGASRQEFIRRQVRPHLAAMASTMDYHANGMTLVTSPMKLPLGVDAAIALTGHDISLRMVCCYSIVENLMMMRFDSLTGCF